MSAITADLLQQIWSAQGLGTVQQVVHPTGGLINACRIINDTHVIRFDLLDYADTISRYQGEAIIYNRLLATAVPVPQVIALDLSKTDAPYAYIILSKMAGAPVLDTWPALSPDQHNQLGQAIGQVLTGLHEQKFAGFGPVYNLHLTRWQDFISEFVTNMSDDLLSANILDTPTLERCRDIVQQHAAMFELGAEGTLVHADFQFANVLQHNGQLTAIIDFEWAFAGDPTWEFRLEDHWEMECPGIRDAIYAGYTRPLAPDHALRVRLYKLLQCLDDMYFLRVDHPNAQEFDREYRRFFALLDTFA